MCPAGVYGRRRHCCFLVFGSCGKAFAQPGPTAMSVLAPLSRPDNLIPPLRA